jgi:hypothetical protein
MEKQKRKNRSETTWTTESEIAFLDKYVGKVANSDTGMLQDREKCLLGYIKAFPLRFYWGKINPKKIKEFLIYTMWYEYNTEITI